jgi:CheY-like chemotaxis protein/HPt (histidine-containing phosphotransfer) domain-containing protein
MGYSARTLVMTAPVAAALIDADGRVVAANGRWTGAAVGDVHAGEGAVLPGAGYAALFAALRSPGTETTICRHDEPGDDRTLRVVPVTDEAGAAGYLLTVERNPPESCPACGNPLPAEPRHEPADHEAHVPLESVDHAKSEFLALLGHEIRTPVSAVVGLVDLMRALALPQDVREVVDGVHRSTQSLKVLIDDLLDLARMETDRLELASQPLSLRELLESVTEPLQEEARRRGILLLAGTSPDLPTAVLGDAGRLRQVLTNLLGNAVKFTERGEVVVSAQPLPDGQTRIVVSDTGRGLDTADRERLFAPFVQADSSAARRHEGAGLGLAVAARLVSRMGGTVEVDSWVGRGTEFRVTLPLAPAPADGVRAVPVARLVVDRIALVAPTRRSTEVLSWLLAAADAEVVPTSLESVIEGTAGVDAVLWCDDAHDPEAARRAERVMAAVGTHGRAVMLSTSDPRTGVVRGPSLITAPITLRRLVSAVNAERRGVRGAPIPVTPLPAGRVLLAEDNEVNRGVFRRMIQLLGLECDAVGDGAAAVAAVLDGPEPYDVVLMDVQMPGMDGLEATRKIRAAGATLPILALTATALRGDQERCLDAGMNSHVSKPVTLPELRAALEPHLTGETPPEPEPEKPAEVAQQPAVDLSRLRDLEEQLADRPLVVTTVSTFLTELGGRRTALSAALARLDRDSLRAAAHTLKSSSALLGADQLAAACAQVERRAAAAVEPELATLVEAVDRAATGTATALNGYLHEVGRSN